MVAQVCDNSEDYTEKKAQIRSLSMLWVVITMVRQVYVVCENFKGNLQNSPVFGFYQALHHIQRMARISMIYMTTMGLT